MCYLMNINAIALDLDGTVLDANSKISNELVELLSTLRNKGMKIFIATGRTKIGSRRCFTKGSTSRWISNSQWYGLPYQWSENRFTFIKS